MGLLALKKATYATPLLLPLIIITILFQFYIGQKHWEVAGHLPSRKCLQRDRRNANRDLNFLEAAYIQPEMRDKEGMCVVLLVKHSLKLLETLSRSLTVFRWRRCVGIYCMHNLCSPS